MVSCHIRHRLFSCPQRTAAARRRDGQMPDIRTCTWGAELLDARHPSGDVHIRQLLERQSFERGRAIVCHKKDFILLFRLTLIVIEGIEEPTCHLGRPSCGLISKQFSGHHQGSSARNSKAIIIAIEGVEECTCQARQLDS